jgi:predicted esterase
MVQTGVAFDEAYARLRADRPLAGKLRTGELSFTALMPDGRARPYTVVVPDDLSAGEELPVRVQLHGGVNRPAPEEGVVAPRARRRNLAGLREITVYPSADRESPWWSQAQVENLAAILDRLKRSYRVDNERVYLTGVSDGGTGAYYVAQRDTTPWSCFLPLNGQLRVLTNPSVGAEGDIYVRNLANKPFFIVNGGRDPLYPVAGVLPLIELFRSAGVSLLFRPQLEAGHDVSWWPQIKGEYEAFVRNHPRDPLPDRLLWETGRPPQSGRAHWLVVESLGSAPGEARFDDFDLAGPGPRDFGMRADVARPGPPQVVEIVKDSDAQTLGLEKGDVVVELNGQGVASSQDLLQALERYVFGTSLHMAVERKGRRQTLEATLERAGPEPLFRRTRPSGRVELEKRGNHVFARTRGVRQFTLLLSPDRIDFEQPVRVTVNDRLAFEGRVQRSVETLLTWAARDNDRSMLFGAELPITLPR